MSKPLSLLVSILLLIPIFSLPLAQSQAYTTITTQTTSPLITYESSTVPVGRTTTETGSATNIFQNYKGTYVYWSTEPPPVINRTDLRNITLPSSFKPLGCYLFAANFNATEGQRFSGSVGNANVRISFFVMDNKSFWDWTYNLHYSPTYNPDCGPPTFGFAVTPTLTYYRLFPLVTSNVTVNSVDFSAIVPHDGEWWIGAIAYGPVVHGKGLSAVKWSWSAFLISPNYVTTMMTLSTVSFPITLLVTQNISQTQQLAQTFSFSAEQVYAGLAAVFGVLFVVTVGLLIRQRHARTKKRR